MVILVVSTEPLQAPPPPVSMVNRGCNVEEDAADTEDARTAMAGQLM